MSVYRRPQVHQLSCAEEIRSVAYWRSETILSYTSIVFKMCEQYSLTTDVDVPTKYSLFHSAALPNIAFSRYVVLICAQLGYHRSVIAIALVLMGRYWHVSGYLPSRLACHRLFATALLIASKFHHDKVFPNSHVASLCGVQLSELNNLERHLLTVLDHSIFVTEEDVATLVTGLRAAQTKTADPRLAFGLNCPNMTVKVQLPTPPRAEGAPGALRHDADDKLLSSFSSSTQYISLQSSVTTLHYYPMETSWGR